MSNHHIPYPHDFDIDHAAAHHEERRRWAFRSLTVSDVLAQVDDLISQEPDERKHPLFHLTAFLLDRQTACDGGQLYDGLRALVLTAIDRCVEAALERED